MIRKILFILFFYFFMILSCSAFVDSDFEALESSKYGIVYENEDYGSRLRRLELDLLGMTQSGDVESRLSTLKKIANNLNFSEPHTKLGYEYQKNNEGKFKNFLNNIMSSISDSGYVTGYTPVVSSYGQDYFDDDFFDSSNNSLYCPYNNKNYINSYNTSNSFFNRLNNHLERNYNKYLSENFKKTDRYYRHRNKFNHRKRADYGRHNKYNNYNRPYNNYLVPTNRAQNIATRSSVRILKD